jgi:hypothetical protein
MTEVTRLLTALEQGDPHAASRLLPLVYDELRKLAVQRMAQEQPGQTLQPVSMNDPVRLLCTAFDATVRDPPRAEELAA